jgi:hypothetical protein
MAKVSKGKPIRQLPNRGALNDLQASRRTIVDYAKATPIVPSEPNPAEIRILATPRR